MKRTLLVDTNRAAYPVYSALCDLGHTVSVVGRSSGETLAKLSPNFIQLDYSDASRLSELVDDRRFDYLVPGCTDLSYVVCAQINGGRYPGIDTVDVAGTMNDKARFRAMAGRLGLTVPRVLPEIAEARMPPVIVKPVDAFSGQGMQVLLYPKAETLANALVGARAASKSGRALVEEFVRGQLYSHSAFIRSRKIIADFFVREDCTTCPFAVDTSCVTVDVPSVVQRGLRRQVERLAESLVLVDGLVHTQFIARDDSFWIIEMTRRCPGDIYALLIEFATGYPYAASYAAPFIGRQAVDREPTGLRERIIRHTVTAQNGAELWGLRFLRKVDIRLWVPLATAGDSLEPSPAGRAAIIFFRADSDAEFGALYEDLLAGRLYAFD